MYSQQRRAVIQIKEEYIQSLVYLHLWIVWAGGNRQPMIIESENHMNKLVCERRMDEGLRTFKDNVCGTIRTIDAGGVKEW